MNYVLVGINHKTAPVGIREQITPDEQAKIKLLKELLKSPTIQEATLLYTCNRIECYGSTTLPLEAQKHLTNMMLSPLNDNQPNQIQEHFYYKQDKEVISHLFSVTSSIDSQIAGENQITGQVKDAHHNAKTNDASGYYLNQLFDHAFHVAKRVKTETEISKGQVSVGSVGVILAKKIFGSLQNKTVLLLGAGKIGELVIKYLNSEQVRKTIIINRTFEKALKLQEQDLGEAYKLVDIQKALLQADVIISSTAAPLEAMQTSKLQRIMQKRHQKPLFIIDLGLPRTIPEEAGELDNLYLYNLDDLNKIATENKNNRLHSIHQAQLIILDETQKFYDKHINFKALPAIQRLGKKWELIRKAEIEKSLSKLSHLDSKDLGHVEKLTQSLVQKILHDPVLSLKTQKDMSEPGVIKIFKQLFRLDDEDKE
ncbi:glutamyl-tRNA reductase [bacterium K02(2017)]|nr:glutamyl-tRNA reductase [bacterium K02(2017)]